jgi:hypothetical protein
VTRVEISITHEVKINGDKSWIRVGLAEDFDLNDKLGRDLSEAVASLGRKTNDELIRVIEQTVETVENYGK